MEIKYSSLTLQQINIFLTAAKYGNFTKASEELHMSQSSVSRNIVLMEESLGIILFVRIKKRVRLTAAGEYLQKALVKPYGQLESVFNHALEMQANAYKTLKVCDVDTTSPDHYLFPITELFEKKFPDADLSIARKDPVIVIDDLAAGKYDMAFLPSVYSDALKQAGLEFQKFIDLQPCFLISKKHSLFSKTNLSYQDLTNNPVVAVSGGKYSMYNDYVKRIPVENELIPEADTHREGFNNRECNSHPSGDPVELSSALLAVPVHFNSMLCIFHIHTFCN